MVAFVLITVATFAGCYFLYEVFIRRIGILRPFFGLKWHFSFKKKEVTSNMKIAYIFLKLCCHIEWDYTDTSVNTGIKSWLFDDFTASLKIALKAA